MWQSRSFVKVFVRRWISRSFSEYEKQITCTAEPVKIIGSKFPRGSVENFVGGAEKEFMALFDESFNWNERTKGRTLSSQG